MNMHGHVALAPPHLRIFEVILIKQLDQLLTEEGKHLASARADGYGSTFQKQRETALKPFKISLKASGSVWIDPVFLTFQDLLGIRSLVRIASQGPGLANCVATPSCV